MKPKLYILTLLFGLSIFPSCTKEEIKDEEYLVFGHFYGHCVGEGCIEIFRLEDDRLLEDQKDQYPGYTTFYEGDFLELSSSRFELAENLMDYFPLDLLNETDTVIGQPDAGDWGGLYIEYNYEGVHKYWLLDQMKSHVPEYLHGFIQKVNEVIIAVNG